MFLKDIQLSETEPDEDYATNKQDDIQWQAMMMRIHALVPATSFGFRTIWWKSVMQVQQMKSLCFRLLSLVNCPFDSA